MKRALVRSLFLLAGALIGLALWRASSDTKTSALEPTSAPAASSAKEAVVEAQPVDAAARAHVDPAPTPAVVAPSAPRKTAEVLVVERGTEKPVAGAEVRWVNRAAAGPPRDRRRPYWRPDNDAALETAPRTLTDANGIALIDAESLPAVISARSGAMYGSMTTYDNTPSPFRVVISADLDFAIQVVDGAGKPTAGVPVGVRRDQAQSIDGDIWNGVTEGEQGIARVRHFQLYMHFVKPGETLYAHVATFSREPVRAPIDVANLPTEPVRLVLPAWGTVVARIHDSAGQPLMPSGCNLANAEWLKDCGLSFSARAWDPTLIEDGRAVWEFVGIGTKLYVDAITLGQSAHACGPGPQVHNEEVAFDLDLGDPMPMITGRLIDEQNTPLAERDVQVGLELKSGKGGSSGGGFPIRTDGAGRFRFALPIRADGGITGTLELRPYGKSDDEGAASIALDDRIHDGTNDVGDLVVHAPMLLASGRVIDDVGAPIAKALLGVDTIALEQGKEVWRSDSRMRGVCTPEGTFEVRGPLITPGRIRLRATCSGYVQLEIPELVSRTLDTTLVLSRAAEIAGRVQLDEADASAKISVRAQRPDAQAKKPKFDFEALTNVKPDGTFELTGLRPGQCDLVFVRDGRQERPTIESFLLRAGEKSADPRLASIDLRGAFPTPTPDPRKRQ